MSVKLRVLQGANAGKEIKVSKEQFVIGRGEDCHLRAKSDAISRRHCILVINQGQVLLRDLGSKNGSYVNGDRVEGDRPLKTGDNLKFGPLEFQIIIDVGIPNGEKRPRVANVKEAAARTFDSSVVDEDVSAWLEELDAIDRVRKASDPDVRQFKPDVSESATVDNLDTKEVQAAADATKIEGSDSQSGKLKPPEKKPPGKLPPMPQQQAANSREAAKEMLKKFNSRK